MRWCQKFLLSSLRGLPKEILHNLKRDCFVASLLAMTEIPRQADACHPFQ
ncbi:MAG: hypothetical protein ACPLPS_05665 [bacterium]